MTRPTSWWWIRHAPVKGAEGRLTGQRDVDCDTSDHRSFGVLAAMLPGDAITIVSSLKRTRQTLEAIVGAGARLPEPVVEPELAEQSFGLWEGLSWAEIQARDPEAYAAFWENPTRNAPPAGESFESQMWRTAAAIERLNIEFAGRDIVSVSPWPRPSGDGDRHRQSLADPAVAGARPHAVARPRHLAGTSRQRAVPMTRAICMHQTS